MNCHYDSHFLFFLRSYVEEAVDYPPADGAMYAPVYKKKGNAPNDESTSGYPDIIHQVSNIYLPYFHIHT